MDSALVIAEFYRQVVRLIKLGEDRFVVLAAVVPPRQFLLKDLEGGPPEWTQPLKQSICVDLAGEIQGAFGTSFGTNREPDAFRTGNVSLMTGSAMHSVWFLGLFALLIFGNVGYMLLLFPLFTALVMFITPGDPDFVVQTAEQLETLIRASGRGGKE